MEAIIKELQNSKIHELHQIGLTPRTCFKGTQEYHDLYHKEKADKYQKAIGFLEASTPTNQQRVTDQEISNKSDTYVVDLPEDWNRLDNKSSFEKGYKQAITDRLSQLPEGEGKYGQCIIHIHSLDINGNCLICDESPNTK